MQLQQVVGFGHWRDAIGAREQRKHTVNTTWGMVAEDNSFGTHEFLQLCDLLGCQPYIAGNVGTGTIDITKSSLGFFG